MYTPTDDFFGTSLLDLAQSWEIFAENLSSYVQIELLQDILNRHINERDKYIAVAGDENEGWEQFYDRVANALALQKIDTEIDTRIPLDEIVGEDPGLKVIVDDMMARSVVELTVGTIVFRARLGANNTGLVEKPYSGIQIGAPPAERTGIGRANRRGHSVLYCAEQERTAVAEVRPARGNVVSVCPATLQRDVRVLDLEKPMNPFVSQSPVDDMVVGNLLTSFGSRMSTPLRYNDDPTEYQDTQIVCEFFAKLGIGGLRYASSLCENGMNLVFFDPGVADLGVPRLVEVESVAVNYCDSKRRLARG